MVDINLRFDVEKNNKSGDEEVSLTGTIMEKSCRITFSNRALTHIVGVVTSKLLTNKLLGVLPNNKRNMHTAIDNALDNLSEVQIGGDLQ